MTTKMAEQTEQTSSPPASAGGGFFSPAAHEKYELERTASAMNRRPEPTKVFQQLKGSSWFNKANGLTPNMIQPKLREFGLTNCEIYDLFMTMDTKKDGMIDQSEFVAGYQLWTDAADKMLANNAQAKPEEEAPAQRFITTAQYTGGAGEYLLCTLSLDLDHVLTELMPSSIEGFIQLLSAGKKPLWTGADVALHSTSAQKTLVEALIPQFNQAANIQQRLTILRDFLVAASQIERHQPQSLPDYIQPFVVSKFESHNVNCPQTLCILEDYPIGRMAHEMTLASGVLNWCMSAVAEPGSLAEPEPGRLTVPLVHLDVKCFNSAVKRDEEYQFKLQGFNSVSESVMIAPLDRGMSQNILILDPIAESDPIL